ncbi:hypothetical protein [Burkholderia pseudomallei]|uniref:hypothetical protein n=1 Tax=Burkholderia pseudomallei TaxID=28450 RepID=UPI0031401564
MTDGSPEASGCRCIGRAGLLVVQADSPQVFAAGWLALPLAALLAMARLAGALR